MGSVVARLTVISCAGSDISLWSCARPVWFQNFGCNEVHVVQFRSVTLTNIGGSSSGREA